MTEQVEIPKLTIPEKIISTKTPTKDDACIVHKNTIFSLDDDKNNNAKSKVKNINTKNNKYDTDIHTTYQNINLEEPWNMAISIKLKQIGEKSAGYRWMHDHEKIYYTKISKIYMILEVILLAIMGTLSSGDFVMFMINNKINGGSGGLIISSTQLLLLLIYCVVKGLYDTGNYSNIILSHHTASSKFNELFLEIDIQTRLPISKREPDSNFLIHKTKEYITAMNESPAIRQSTIDKYILATENEDIYKPPIAGEFDKIEIVIHDENNIKVKSRSITSDKNEKSPKTNNIDPKLKNQIDRWLNNL